MYIGFVVIAEFNGIRGFIDRFMDQEVALW